MQSRREFLRTVALGSLAFLLPCCSRVNNQTAPPNILFIMADDMGYGDPGCYNPESKAPTPTIDRLAREGMRFTDAHAPGAVCVPSRYGLLTGRYPFRMTREPGTSLIAPDRMTIGTLMQEHGYHTGCVGKWHLGFDGGTKLDRDFSTPMRGGPVDRGFDYYFGIPASLDIPPYYYIENDQVVEPPTDHIAASSSEGWSPIQGAFWREGGIAPGFTHREVLPEFAEKAVSFLDQHSQNHRDQPFFLYLALAAPHTPWLPGEDYEGDSGAGMYGDFAVHVDAAIGRVLSTLVELGLQQNTLVVFTSDNGPVWYDDDVEEFRHDSAGMLRGMKGDIWEAGHRMPFIARWPGHIRPGSESGETICFTDMLATFAGILEVDLPPEAGADSYNILPILLEEEYEQPLREATIHYSTARFFAIRQGRWKLVPHRGSGGFSEPRRITPGPGEPEGQLYDMEVDPRETTNLYQDRPEVVKRLSALLDSYRQQDRTVSSR
ncbi:MAG TPA: arylsulfatase [bacterium]|nr:arylsulfatase [bacterium]